MTTPRKHIHQIIVAGLLIFFSSQILQNLFPNHQIRNHDIFYKYLFNPLNIAPKNWGMFTHWFSNATERRVAIYTNKNKRIIQEAKGLNFPWRRSPRNDLLEQIIVNYQNGKPGFMQKRYANKLCQRGVKGHIVVAVIFDERKIPISNIMRGETSQRVFPFKRVSEVYCEDLGYLSNRSL